MTWLLKAKFLIPCYEQFHVETTTPESDLVDECSSGFYFF